MFYVRSNRLQRPGTFRIGLHVHRLHGNVIRDLERPCTPYRIRQRKIGERRILRRLYGGGGALALDGRQTVLYRRAVERDKHNDKHRVDGLAGNRRVSHEIQPTGLRTEILPQRAQSNQTCSTPPL